MSKSNFKEATDQVNYLVELSKKRKEQKLSWSDVAEIYQEKFGGTKLSDDAIRSRVKRAVASQASKEVTPVGPESSEYQRFADGHVEARVLVNEDLTKLSSDEVLLKLGYNPESWELSYLRVANWEKGVLDSLYSIRFKITPKKATKERVDYIKIAEEHLKDFKPKAPQFVKAHWDENADMKKCLLLNQIELHLGKLAETIETGDEYNTEIALRRLNEITEGACHLAQVEKCGNALLIIGGDFFNSESNGRTTRGTEIRNDHSYKYLFQMGLDAYVDMIQTLRGYVPNLTVMLCEGNHARAMEYFLYKSLQAYFRDASGVHFMDSVRDTQAFKFGKTALFFNHGDADHKRLVGSIPAEFPEIYGQTKFRYLFVGHLHKLETSNTENGLHFHRVPAPCGTDQWTSVNRFGFGTIPSYELMIMHSEHGWDTSKFVYF